MFRVFIVLCSIFLFSASATAAPLNEEPPITEPSGECISTVVVQICFGDCKDLSFWEIWTYIDRCAPSAG